MCADGASARGAVLMTAHELGLLLHFLRLAQNACPDASPVRQSRFGRLMVSALLLLPHPSRPTLHRGSFGSGTIASREPPGGNPRVSPGISTSELLARFLQSSAVEFDDARSFALLLAAHRLAEGGVDRVGSDRQQEVDSILEAGSL